MIIKGYVIREIQKEEYFLLKEFMYEAIFQRDETKLLPRSIVERPELRMYFENFGQSKDDHCLVAEKHNRLIGSVWVRNIKGYGSVDDQTPELAISLLKKYRNKGIGTHMMKEMLIFLKEKGYHQVSLSVDKDNYAVKLYQSLGFKMIGENDEDYIMVYYLK